MPADAPKLSIGLIVRNGENYLAATLESLLQQTFTDFEVIVSDNASDDATEAIGRSYAARDPRVRYHRNERDLGVAANFNQTVTLSRGVYYKCSAHDDLYEPTFLEQCVAALDSDPGVILSHCTVQFIDGEGRPLVFDEATATYADPSGRSWAPDAPFPAQSHAPTDRFRDVLFGVIQSYPIFGVTRTEALRSTALHKDFYGADHLILTELALRGRFHQVDEPLYIKRVHASMSGFLTRDEKRKHINPGMRASRGPDLRVHWLRRPLDYLRAVFSAPLSLAEQLRCVAICLRRWLRFAMAGSLKLMRRGPRAG